MNNHCCGKTFKYIKDPTYDVGPFYYRVYGRYKGQKSFKAMDLSNCCQVGNLIYATFFTSKEQAEKTVNSLQVQNPDWEFELRKV